MSDQIQIKGIRTSREEIRVTTTPRDVLQALKKSFLAHKGLPPDAYIYGGTWKVDTEYATSHSWTETRELREVTQEEIDTMQAFATLRSAFMPGGPQ